jgi:hypothetical protein
MCAIAGKEVHEVMLAVGKAVVGEGREIAAGGVLQLT